MAEVKGKVGSFEMTWKDLPQGPQGQCTVVIAGKEILIRWTRDRSGLWIEFPDAVRGFDFEKRTEDSGREVFRVTARGSSEVWDAVRFERAGEISAASSGKKKSGAKIRAQMPGKIVKISVKAGEKVVKDQTLLVMEAMKMENEIRATSDGVIKDIKVTVGQAVETGADLILID